MKKVVHTSNLALRFYKSDGWTRECLEQYLVSGEIKDTQGLPHLDSVETAYFILSPYSRLDILRLYEDQVSRVVRTFNDNPELSDVQLMETKNW